MAIGIEIWARVVRGLEWVAAAEAELLAGISNVETGHRDLFFQCDKIDIAHQLRCVDDVFVVWGNLEGLDNTRDSLRRLGESLRELPSPPLEIPPTARYLRVTASFLGRRNYSRYEIEEIAGQALASRLGLLFADSHSKASVDAVWCRLHLVQDHGRVGLRTAAHPLHRRPWRTEGKAGALHPPIAAAMAQLADLHSGQVVVDPFMGTGTLLIEAGLQCAGLTLVGRDIDETAVKGACEHARRANCPIDIGKADSSVFPLPPADRVLSNPPWGRAVQACGQLTAKNLVRTLLGSLNPCGQAVLLADQELNLPKLLQQARHNPLLIQPLRISGRLADMVVVGSLPCFPETEKGQALLRAWKKHSDTT